MNPVLAHLLASPDAALLAVVAGILLLYAEFNLPGTVLLGCFGALSLMLGLFALSRMPLRPAALGLALAGFTLILLGLASTHFLLPTTLGLATLATSFLHLVERSRYGTAIDLPTALVAASLFSATTVWLGRIALRARRNKHIPARVAASAQGRLNNSNLR